ncbi:5' exonuclease Apollo [Merluccius polli]|uniref:5' exonuclease Apollo n=1 Tax=Merluccius polli TaxID=89951 RepID=A0AA47P3Y2_MERPO|nr:5' exonuclease Apollo [Merluccius polli]
MSVNGRPIPHTPLAVDYWYVRRCPRIRLFFLSHMHSDHTAGLTSTWSGRPIYCSPLSAALLKLKLQVKQQWIHPLEVDEPHMLPLDDIGKERLTVTLIDANHCPGSVMFLFQGYFGSILYTGDFRYAPSMLREPCLRNNINIDVLYLDNTNCDPTRVLPTRQRATQKIKEIIRSHPDHEVVIGLYSLGKESLLVDLAMEFKSWVEVSVARMETLRVLELPDVFTTDREACRLRVVDQADVCYANMQQWNRVSPTLAILPTSRPLVSFHPNVHVVPYSDHSSYRELEDFISALKPTSMIPIVGNCLPGSFSALLPSRKRRDVLVPESVQNYMLKQPSVQSAQQRHKGPPPRSTGPRPPPRGVMFESPLKSSQISSKVNRDSSTLSRHPPPEEEVVEEEDDNHIVQDMSQCCVQVKCKKRFHDLCGVNIVNMVTEEMVMAESITLSQFSQSNFAPNKIMTNTVPSFRPIVVRRVISTPETNTNRVTVSNCDIMSSCNDPLNEENEAVRRSHEEVEEMEESILQQLSFTAEDMRSGGVLDASLVEQFFLIPQTLWV